MGLSAEISSEDGKHKRSVSSVPDGEYSAQLVVLQNGELTPLSEPQPFNVKTLNLSPEKSPTDRFSFFSDVAKVLVNADVLNDNVKKALEKIKNQQGAFLKNKNAENELKKLEEKRLQLLELKYQLISDQTKKKRFQYYLPGVRDRLRRVYNSQWESVQITDTHRENFKMAKGELERLAKEFEAIKNSK